MLPPSRTYHVVAKGNGGKVNKHHTRVFANKGDAVAYFEDMMTCLSMVQDNPGYANGSYKGIRYLTIEMRLDYGQEGSAQGPT